MPASLRSDFIHIASERTIHIAGIRNEFKDVALPREGEPVIRKHKTNAFIGTELENKLRTAGRTTLIIAGVITNNSVEATVRMAGDLGFETYLAADACFTFARKDWDGRIRSADEVHAMSLANLSGEYCTIVTTSEALEAASQSRGRLLA